jgi:hypothetical protein|tara:strand:- start:96 stop:212 length:117 start_codon:yes stop_codon:yes gene_type:complete
MGLLSGLAKTTLIIVGIAVVGPMVLGVLAGGDGCGEEI